MSEDLSIFDIAGPVMVGPSSSHTAGACKIGQFARALFHATPTEVVFYLHGSFGEVYKGHATDRALLGGVMKFQTSDPRIRDAFEIAKEKNLKYEFIVKDLGENAHPNTVKIVLKNENSKMSVTGSSIGGGMIEITKVDNFDVLLHGRAGKYLSLVAQLDHNDECLLNFQKHINKLEDISVAAIDKSDFKKKTLAVISLEGRRIKLSEVIELEKLEGVDFVRSLSKLETQ
ncbi:L-serine ammonia-lyase, iron-sulfur-dependent, subunit beta [Candidatus Peregrinibacteria bacterium CG10_big_fil_rev_8_21_14_0_10_36_19]|nr:MAG: L-serine ammonia-lyase, iron-sulfur-dependent, subunit beta [Candidatus Peregrinibacteria bacterium CG10_big_fil_rev_8_21_14_0_10_36_19]